MSLRTVFARGPENDFERFLTDSTRPRLLGRARQRNPSGSHAQVAVLEIRVRREVRRRAVPHDATLFDDGVAIGDARERPEVLVDDEDRQARGLETSDRAVDLGAYER